MWRSGPPSSPTDSGPRCDDMDTDHTDTAAGHDTAAVGGAHPDLDTALSGLDALELAPVDEPGHAARLWAGLWPKVLAIGGVFILWELLVLAHWRPDYILPGPGPVMSRLGHDVLHGGLLASVGITLRRAATGYGLSLV